MNSYLHHAIHIVDVSILCKYTNLLWHIYHTKTKKNYAGALLYFCWKKIEQVPYIFFLYFLCKLCGAVIDQTNYLLIINKITLYLLIPALNHNFVSTGKRYITRKIFFFCKVINIPLVLVNYTCSSIPNFFQTLFYKFILY